MEIILFLHDALANRLLSYHSNGNVINAFGLLGLRKEDSRLDFFLWSFNTTEAYETAIPWLMTHYEYGICCYDFHNGLTLPLGSYSCQASSPDLVLSLDGETRSVPETTKCKHFHFLFFLLLGLAAQKLKKEASFICSVMSISANILYHIIIVVTISFWLDRRFLSRWDISSSNSNSSSNNNSSNNNRDCLRALRWIVYIYIITNLAMVAFQFVIQTEYCLVIIILIILFNSKII